jgi:tRNA/tmRNA/rRNA uracil-C5-methylase (TrmA/RlmC/RlmD family)
MPLAPGSLIDIEPDKPAAGGRMLGRHQGHVVLVWGAIPGERVRAKVERVGKGVVYADTVEVLVPSTDRRAASADWRCGGNVLAHVAYQRQLQLKGEIVQDAFIRIGRVPLPKAVTVIESPESGYRMRARLHAHGGRLGFYREGTHELCSALATSQLLPSTNAWIAQAESILQRERITGLAGVEIAENVAGDQRACHLELHGGVDAARFSMLADGLNGLSAQRADRPDVEKLAGDPAITDVLSLANGHWPVTLTLRRDVRAFFQANRFLLEDLVRHVIGLVPPGPIVDLYAGVGLFGLSLAAAGAGPVTLVEADPISGADLKANAEPFAEVRVKRRSVEDYLATVVGARQSRPVSRGPEPGPGAATFIVDPPRTGMSKQAMAGVIALQPATIVYVSCDVATLARDTRTLLDAGYTLGPMTAFDLFPNTAHVETVALYTA